MNAKPLAFDPDANLVIAAQNGDQQAFEALFCKYQRKVTGFARKFLGDEHLAEDVVQDVFLQVHRKLSSFRAEARFSTWLFRISINACKSKRLSTERQRRLSEDEAIAKRAGPESPERAFDRHELASTIARGLDELSAEQRLIIELKAVQDLSYTEIGEATSQSETQVRGKLYRARKAFRVFHEAA